MRLQITLDRDSTQADALRAIRTIETAYELAPLAKPYVFAEPVSDFAKECQTIAAELDASDAAELAITDATGSVFNAAELAADAVPAPPAYPLAAAPIDPATVGFGGPAPVPAVVTEADLTGATSVPPPPTAAQSGVPLDSSGLPHDPRIHAATRTTMKDGTWKKKPRVTDEEVAAVTAELRGVMDIPAPAAAPAYVVGPSTTEVLGHQVTTNFAPPAPIVPAPPQVSVAPVLGTPSTFPEFIAWVSPLVTSGKLTVLNVNAAALGLGLVNGSGVGSIQLLANRPDLVPAAYAALSAQVAQ